MKNISHTGHVINLRQKFESTPATGNTDGNRLANTVLTANNMAEKIKFQHVNFKEIPNGIVQRKLKIFGDKSGTRKINIFLESPSYAAEHILIETYRRCRLPVKTIMALCDTSGCLRSYILNVEKNNMRQGLISHNTLAAICSSCELRKFEVIPGRLRGKDLLLKYDLGMLRRPILDTKTFKSFLELAKKSLQEQLLSPYQDILFLKYLGWTLCYYDYIENKRSENFLNLKNSSIDKIIKYFDG